MQTDCLRAGPHLIAAVATLLLLIAFDARADNRTIIIKSGDVERLYAVVGNPENVNKTVVLQPGTYSLTAVGPSGARSRGGGLMLQKGMKLLGWNTYADADHDGVWDATLDGGPVISGETVIDGTGIAPYQDVGPDGKPEVDCAGDSTGFDLSGTIAVTYRDRNTISRLTILAGPGALALSPPHSAYLPPAGYVIEISNNFLDNGSFSVPGAAFFNVGCRMRNASSTLLFDHNIVRGNAFGVAIVNGLTNQSGDVRQGPSLRAVVSANHFIGNVYGLHSRNTLGTDGGWINVYSTGNLFAENEAGIESTAGTDNGTPSGANGNQYDLLSYRDTFRQNSVGVLGVGGWRVNLDTISGTSNNELRMVLVDDRYEGGDAVHIWPTFPEPRPGVDKGNRVTALVRGSTLSAAPLPKFLFIDPVAGDTNVVRIVGSDADFLRSNGAPPIRTQYLILPNPFDLMGAVNKLHFAPTSTGYQVTAAAGALNSDVGAVLDFSGPPNGPFPIDDDTIVLPLPFAFPFEGNSYEEVFVNTDGNLTFGTGDSASTARDVARLISGAPRIAALLTDLAVNVGGEIHANALGDRMIITWIGVPSWATGLTDQNTFQIVLFLDGSIDLVYGAIGPTDAVVGIAPGGNLGPAPGVDLSKGTATGSTIYELFLVTLQGP